MNVQVLHFKIRNPKKKMAAADLVFDDSQVAWEGRRKDLNS
jgi:hypothetical protein